MVTSQDSLLWLDSSAWHSERNKEARKTEEVNRQEDTIKEWEGMGFGDLLRAAGSGREEMVERYCCSVIFGDLTTIK